LAFKILFLNIWQWLPFWATLSRYVLHTLVKFGRDIRKWLLAFHWISFFGPVKIAMIGEF